MKNITGIPLLVFLLLCYSACKNCEITCYNGGKCNGIRCECEGDYIGYQCDYYFTYYYSGYFTGGVEFCNTDTNYWVACEMWPDSLDERKILVDDFPGALADGIEFRVNEENASFFTIPEQMQVVNSDTLILSGIGQWVMSENHMEVQYERILNGVTHNCQIIWYQD